MPRTLVWKKPEQMTPKPTAMPEFKPGGIVQVEPQDAPEDIRLKDERHRIYDWLKEVGVPLMDVGQENRRKAHDLIVGYGKFYAEKLRRELVLARRTNEERAKARRERAKRKAQSV